VQLKRRGPRERAGRRLRPGQLRIVLLVVGIVASAFLGPVTNAVPLPLPLVRWKYEAFALIVGILVATAVVHLLLDRRSEARSAERKLADRARMTRRVESTVRKDIEGHLADVSPLSPGLLARPDVLKQPGSGLSARGRSGGRGGTGRLIRHAEPVAEVFREAGQSLLILGEEGSGKSVLLAQLCLGLCEARAGTGDPPVIPVLVSLSSWQHEDSLDAWLGSAVADRYAVPATLAQEWLDDGVLLPMLDDLDAVPAALRGRVIEGVNDFLRTGLRPLAIACRTKEYLDAGTCLELSHAVEVAPLGHAEVAGYLGRLDSAAARAASGVPREDRAWWGLVSTPLMLGIISRISVHAPGTAIPAKQRREQRREQVIATYLDELARRPGGASASFSPEDGLRWLGWLAAWMSRHNAREFGYDTISPAWIADTSGDPVSLTISPAILLPLAISLAILGSAVIALFGDLAYAWQSLLTVIACGPLLASVTLAKLLEYHFRPDEPIKPVARVAWPGRRDLPRPALLMMLCGMAGTLATESIPGLFTSDSTAMVANKLLVVGITSLLPGLLLGSETRSIPDEALLAPGARLRRSRATAWRGTVFVAVPISAISATLLALRWNDDPLAGLTWFFSYGIICAACMWLTFGGAPVIQHWALRRQIARRDYGPPEYLEFLDWAAARMLLRTAGSAYTFPHQEIQDYLAASWDKANQRHTRRKADAGGRSHRQAR
jgi:hypothetical protein